MSKPNIKIAVLGACCFSLACGGSATSPSSYPEPPSLAVNPISVLKLIPPVTAPISAEFVLSRNGGPGLVHYHAYISIGVSPLPADTDMTVNRVEQWILGPDESVYAYQIDTPGKKMGFTSHTVGINVNIRVPDEPVNTRPIATTHRVRVEYTYDYKNPFGVQVLTAEQMIVSTVPSDPLMTALTVSADAPAAPSLVPARPLTFVAAGAGGTAPYQYQWQFGNNVMMRDWSADATFVWDPKDHPGVNAVSMTVLARSANHTKPEVMNVMTIYLTK